MTDQFRLEQVIKNLLSNALKFTASEGTVTLRIRQVPKGMEFNVQTLQEAEHVIEFSVTDTGIGIPREKQKDIFEAFQQADGSTNRKYGGTGLGLSISKMLVGLLGGEMKLKSETGKGSTFYVYLPLHAIDQNQAAGFPENIKGNLPPHISGAENSFEKKFSVDDDRNSLTSGDKILLIVEDDENFAKVLVDFSHERKFKTITTNQGDIALKLASQYHPVAILLDMQLPVMDGWTALKKLKEDSSLSEIPVHIMSAADKGSLGIKYGASTYLRKPLDKEDLERAFSEIENSVRGSIKNLLILDDSEKSLAIENSIQSLSCKSIQTVSVEQAQSLLHDREHFDAMLVLVNNEKDWTGLKNLISWTKTEAHLESLPMIVYSEQELEMEQKIYLDEFENVSTSSGNIESVKNVLREIFAGKPVVASEKKDSSTSVEFFNTLEGRTVLITDDDMRNTYSISAILEEKGMNIIIAGNGIETVKKLEDNPSIEIILLDIMMPDMDGYEVLRKIKSNEVLKDIPVITITASALSSTCEKCMALGASAFLTKPIHPEQLVNLIEVWINN